MAEPLPTRPNAAVRDAPPSAPPRFSWPMRFFLAALIFDMVFHSLGAIAPYADWLKSWDLPRLPQRLPTVQEMADLEAETVADKPSPLADRWFESCDAVWDYLKPWPSQPARHKLDSWEEKGKFMLSWLVSRLDFFEGLTGVRQDWTMFSPDVQDAGTVARMLLLFRDGSEQVVRLTADPDDLTHYGHWFEKKVLAYELRVAGRDRDSRLGYCNYLSHRYRTNAAGSPLAAIYIYEVKYRYPAPDEDAPAVLAAQNGPPGWEQEGPMHEYDVARRELRELEEGDRQALQRELNLKTP